MFVELVIDVTVMRQQSWGLELFFSTANDLVLSCKILKTVVVQVRISED